MVRSVVTAGVALALLAGTAQAAGPKIGMSWANYQEERWKIDERGLREELVRKGATLVTTDAQSSTERQAADIESLIAQGVKVLLIVAWDSKAIIPSIEKASAEAIPVIAYERQIENTKVFYTAFDPIEVGRIQARGVFAVKPKGNYALIKGSPTDQYAHYVLQGQHEVLDAAIADKDIKIVGEEWTPGWVPDTAQRNMENILTATDDKVDAVVASNDGTAGGAVAALTAAGLAGKVPVSGQDGDIAALNRIALGTQTVTAWKDARELGKLAADVALDLAGGKSFTDVTGSIVWDKGPEKLAQRAKVLAPVAVTRDNLDQVVRSGWITKDQLCKDVPAASAPAACR